MDDRANPRVVIIDDDDAFRDRVCRALRLCGWEVQTVARTADTAAQVRKIAPDVVLVALEERSGTGLELLTAVKAMVPGVAVIALADLGSIAGALESVKRGADHYLTKPVSADEIAAACARLRGPMHGSAPPVFASLARMEWEYIHRVLADCDGNLSQTARLLGIHRRSLQRKLSKYPPKQ